jgi:hypothetical protein
MHGRIMVSSLRGDVDVRLRRHGGMIVRARGTKIDLGGMAAQLQPNGWSQVAFGQAQEPAIVELRSSHGTIRFAVVQ